MVLFQNLRTNKHKVEDFHKQIQLIFHSAINPAHITDTHMGSTDSMVSTTTRLRARLSGVQIPAGARDLSLPQNIQTTPGAHPASYSTSTEVLYLG